MTEPTHPELTQIRLSKRAVDDDAWIKAFLGRAPAGVLATAAGEQPFLSTKLFVYDEGRHCIFFHSASAGRVWENVQRNPKVCFTAYEMGRVLPAERACSFSLEYQSVVVFGALALAAEPAVRVDALRLFMRKYAPHYQPGQDYPPIQESDLSGVAVYRLVISGWSGKAAPAAPDFPGAYRFEEVRPA